MSEYTTNVIIILIAVVASVYLVIRVPRSGYWVGILVVSLLFILRDVLMSYRCESGDECGIWLFSRILVGVSFCTPVCCIKHLIALLRSRRLGITVTWKAKVFASVVCVGMLLLGPVWWTWFGLVQCYYYHSLVSEPSLAARLSVKPVKIALPIDHNTPALSLGYAKVAIRSDTISSVKLIFKAGIRVDCSGRDVLFLQTFSQGVSELSQALAEEGAYSLLIDVLWMDSVDEEPPSTEDPKAVPTWVEMTEDPYNWDIKIVNTLPKTYREVFLMKRRAFAEYLLRAVFKTLMVPGDIGTFETDSVQGIVLFGYGQQPGRLFAEVFSKDSNVGRAILIKSDSFEESEKALLSLLGSFKFTVSELPDEDTLREIIVAELSQHEKFVALEKELEEESNSDITNRPD